MSIATRYWTYTELLTKVQMDLDLEGEIFIQPAEFLGYFNEAVDKSEELLHGLYEDYFLDKETITLVSGTSEYDMPSRIYAHKIRRVIYRNGSRSYTINRLRDWKKFELYALDQVGGSQGSAAEYRYFIINSSAGSPKFIFTPEVGEAGEYITVWFLRQANRFVTGSDTLDIPEAANFVMQYVKCRCYEKEGHPNLTMALGTLVELKSSLEGILAAMAPDADNEIEMDTSIYGEMN
jgi:hypothetical protein